MMYMEAFRDLSSERQIGMSIGPIPYSHVQRYADEMELFGDAHECFCKIISSVDADYLMMISEPKAPEAMAQADKVRNVVTLDDKAGVIRLFKRLAKKSNGRP